MAAKIARPKRTKRIRPPPDTDGGLSPHILALGACSERLNALIERPLSIAKPKSRWAARRAHRRILEYSGS
jgi:hypothetical protein